MRKLTYLLLILSALILQSCAGTSVSKWNDDTYNGEKAMSLVSSFQTNAPIAYVYCDEGKAKLTVDMVKDVSPVYDVKGDLIKIVLNDKASQANVTVNADHYVTLGPAAFGAIRDISKTRPIVLFEIRAKDIGEVYTPRFNMSGLDAAIKTLDCE